MILFGGTFDPVHRAHISCARAASRVMAQSQVRLLPNCVPPHRPQPIAKGAHRMAMLELACARYPELQPDDWELQQTGASYSLLTLQHFRQQLGPQHPLIFMLGEDSLNSLHTWHHWQEYEQLCHLLVVPRPNSGVAAQQAVSSEVDKRFPEVSPGELLKHPSGMRTHLRGPRLDVSSTAVRQALQAKGHCRALDPAVEHYIHEHQLYGIPIG